MAATMAPVILYEHAETFGIENLNERALPAREILDAGIPVIFPPTTFRDRLCSGKCGKYWRDTTNRAKK